MPGFDGTGPMGAGSMTGGARGFCNPAASEYPRPFGRGMGFGRGSRGGYGSGMSMRRGLGRGFGRCRWSSPAYEAAYPADPAAEINMLKVQADSIQNALDAINRRMAQLQGKTTE
jgi:hypothetical protein